LNKTISVVLPNYNGKNLLEEYLPFTFQSLVQSNTLFEVIVVDDCSSDDSVTFLRTYYPEIKIIQNEKNRGFSFSCNRGIYESRFDLVLLLNSDIKLSRDYLEVLLPYFEDQSTFGVMGKMLDPSGKTVEIAAKIPRFNGFKLKTDKQAFPKDPSFGKVVTSFLSGGNCLLDRKKLVELKGFDEIYSPFYMEDLDLSIRAWKLGWKCYYEHEAVSFHLGSATTRTFFGKREIKEIYFRNRMFFHAIHLDRKDLKIWKFKLLFLEVLPKLLLGQFWILNSFTALQRKQYRIDHSRRKIRQLMMKYRGRKSIAQITTEINTFNAGKQLIRL
jgi:GT2 family glycosyltransferase